jgi:hypothetical protein
VLYYNQGNNAAGDNAQLVVTNSPVQNNDGEVSLSFVVHGSDFGVLGDQYTSADITYVRRGRCVCL